MARKMLVALLGGALAIGGAAQAAANSFTWDGAVSTSADPTLARTAFGSADPRCANARPQSLGDLGTVHYDAFALRNVASSIGTSCVSVTLTTPCDSTAGSALYTPFFDPSHTESPKGGLGRLVCNDTGFTYDALVGSGETFVPIVLGPADAAYTLKVSGAALALAQEVAGSGKLNGSFAFHASSLPDGSGVEGTASLIRNRSTGPSEYAGDVRCLVVDGDAAKLVVAFTSTSGIAPKYKGALWRLHEQPDAMSRTLLDQVELDKRLAACPPNADGPVNPITGGRVSVVDDPPATAG